MNAIRQNSCTRASGHPAPTPSALKGKPPAAEGPNRELAIRSNALKAIQKATGKEKPTAADFAEWIWKLPVPDKLYDALRCLGNVGPSTARELVAFAKSEGLLRDSGDAVPRARLAQIEA